MPLTQVAAGARIVISHANQYYDLLKGVVGETITLIYNAAPSIKIQPSSDPAASTDAIQINSNAGVVLGAITYDGKFEAADGTVALPGLTFDDDTDTGMYRVGANTMGIAAGGAEKIRINSTGLSTDAGVSYVGGSGVPLMRYRDDFATGIDGSVAASPLFALGWARTTINGTATTLAPVANHPGIVRLTTTATATSTINLFGTQAAGSLLPADTFDMTIIMKPAATVDSSMVFALGLGDTTSLAVGAVPANGIYIEKAAADTSYFGVCRTASVQTRTAALATVTNGTWVKFRVRRSDASTISFSVDGGAEVTVATNVPTAVLLPFMHIDNAGVAVDRTIDVDFFELTVSGITR